MRKLCLWLCLLVLSVSAASASIIINTDQSASGNLGTVDLNQGDTGATITGLVGSTPVLFTGTEELIVPSGGQARIEAVDSAFQSLSIALGMSLLFDRLVFNLDADADGSLTVTAIDQGGASFQQVLSLSQNGQNFINVQSDALQDVRSVSFTSDVDLSDIAQVRIGPFAVAVPEPATVGLLATGLIGLMFFRRRR